jgi:hypothetical protein
VAQSVYEEILRQDPGNTTARLGLARIAAELEDYPAALEHLDRAETAGRATAAEREAIQIVRGRTYKRMGKPAITVWLVLYPVWREGSAGLRASLDAELKELARALPAATEGREEVLGYVALRPASAGPAAPADDKPSLPEEIPRITILPRSAWQPPRQANGWDLDPMGRPYRTTVHHSAHDDPGMTQSHAEAAEMIRRIQRYHIEENGWADIGYHFVIDGRGQIWEARLLKYQGAHAGGVNNRGNIGIVLLGDFNAHPPTSPQVRALTNLVDFLCRTYRIRRDQIYGHSDFKATDCPGRYLRTILARLRSQ